MYLKSLAATGLVFTAAHAFVVVPEISEADNDIANSLPFEQASSETGILNKLVKLDCPGCPLTMKHYDGRYHTMTNIENHLELTFSVVSDAKGLDHLLVNDFELYPKAASWYSVLRAPQIPAFAEAATKHPRKIDPNTPQLGYSLSVRPVAKDNNQQLELLEIDLQIIEVGNSFVSDIPSVNVKLIKAPVGQLMMAKVETTETFVPSPKEDENKNPADSCTTLYCEWRAAILKNMRGKHCGGHKHHGMHSQGRHGMHGHHGHHAHNNGHFRQRHHTWGQLAKNITSHILLPILIGIVAGVGVSIIGMMVGTLVVCLWRVFVRRQPPFARRHCRRRSRKSSHREPAAIEEKAGLMTADEQEEPPAYKDDEEEAPKTGITQA